MQIIEFELLQNAVVSYKFKFSSEKMKLAMIHELFCLKISIILYFQFTQPFTNCSSTVKNHDRLCSIVDDKYTRTEFIVPHTKKTSCFRSINI